MTDAVGGVHGSRIKLCGDARLHWLQLPPGWAFEPPDSSELPVDVEIDLSTAAGAFRVPPEGAWQPIGPQRGVSRFIESSVAEFARTATFIHAAVVQCDRGAIVLPGGTHAGKSTLVAALVERGCRYFSDEYCVVLPGGRIEAFARPLRLRGQPERAVMSSSTQVGSTSEGWMIAALQYSAAEDWDVHEMSEGEAALELLRWAFAVRRFPAETVSAASALARDSGVLLKGTRGDARSAADRLLAYRAL